MCAAVGSTRLRFRRIPFQATIANQLKGADLAEPIASKTLVAVRSQTGSPPCLARFKFQFRPDGSALIKCEGKPVNNAQRRPCRGFNPENAEAPDRDLGTWRIELDQLVFRRIRFSAEGRDEGRFTLHAANGVIGVRRLSGSGFCLPGVVTFE